MLDRKLTNLTLWFTVSLALLAGLLLAFQQPVGSNSVATQVACSPPDLILPPSPPATCLGAAMPIDTVLQVTALTSESEEQDQVDTPDELRIAFLIPCAFCKVADRQLVAPRPIPSCYPLRC